MIMLNKLHTLCRHSNVLRFHVAEVGFLPLTHEVKVQRTVAEGTGSHRWGVELEAQLLPHVHHFLCEVNTDITTNKSNVHIYFSILKGQRTPRT